MSEKIPAGYYNAKAVQGSFEMAPSKSGFQAGFEVELVDLGRRVTSYLQFAGGATEYSAKKLAATGFDDEKEDFDGTTLFQVEIAYEMYDGKERMKVDVKYGGGPKFKEPASEAQRRMYGAQLKQAMAAARGGKTSSNGNAEAYPKDWDDSGKPGITFG